MVDRQKVQTARDGVADVLHAIDAKEVEATVGQTSYLRGVVEGLDHTLESGEKPEE